MRELTPIEYAIDRSIGDNGGGCGKLGLLVGETLGGKGPGGVLEAKAAEDNITHDAARSRIAAKLHQMLDGRGHHLGPGHVFTGKRVVVDDARRAIEVPGAPRTKPLEHIVNVISPRPRQRPPAPSREEHGMVLRVDGLDAKPGLRPELEDDNLCVAQVLPLGVNVAGLELKRPSVALRGGGLCTAHPLVSIRVAD